MHTQHISALGTGPPVLFGSYEMTNAEFPDVFEILDHAHAIFGPIALIEMFQAGAGKVGATETVFYSTAHDPLTVLDQAGDAGVRFMHTVDPAAGTGIPLPSECMAKMTVHATGGDQHHAGRACHCRASRCHIFIPTKVQQMGPCVYAYTWGT
jgi:hypothetical protein